MILIASSIILFCLAFPMLPPQWAMRFELMVFVPGSIIAGNLVAFFERDLDQMVVSVIMLGFVLLFQSLPTFNRIGPTLNPLQYQDLLSMSRFIPPGSAVTAPGLPTWRYWIEYLFDSRNVGPIPLTNETIYLIADNRSPLPMPGPRLLYSGKALNLYFVTAPGKR